MGKGTSTLGQWVVFFSVSLWQCVLTLQPASCKLWSRVVPAADGAPHCKPVDKGRR